MSNWTEFGYDPSKYNWHKGENPNLKNGGYPNNYFFVDTLRSIRIAFGNFFNDIFVIHYDSNGIPIKQINVPIKHGPRIKAFDYRKELESGNKYYIPLPNLAFRIDSIAFAQQRYAGANESRTFYSRCWSQMGVDEILSEKFWSDIQPVPYDITITMEAKCEYMSDANQIMEQILPRFAPEAYMDLKEFWFCNIRRSIKFRCESCNIDTNTDFGEEDKRETTISFSFKIEAFLYKPIVKSNNIIDKIITSLVAHNSNEIQKTTIEGNYDKDNLLTNRFNFSEEFGTKIDYVYKMLPFEEQPLPEITTDGIIQNYKYEKTDEITNYPKNSKFLLSVSSINDEDKSIWTSYNNTYSSMESSVAVDWINKTSYNKDSSNNWKNQYWSITGDSLDNPNVSGNYIYEIYYNNDYIIEPENETTSAKFGGTIIKKYKNMFGFGDFSNNSLKFGNKFVTLNNDIIENASYVIKTELSSGDT